MPTLVARAELRDYAHAIELVGDVRASQRVILAAEVSGRVVRIARRVGERVGGGSPLITIDPATYQATLIREQANLAQVREQLAQLQAGPRETEVEVQRSAVAAARARYDAARDNLMRQEQLFAEGVVAESALIAARSSADAASADLRAQEQRLAELQEGARSEEIGAARARLEAAEGAVELARLQLERTTVSPPFDAVVNQLLVEEGQYVGPGTPLAEVVSAGSGERIDVEAWFNVSQTEARGIPRGTPVELRSAALSTDEAGVIRGQVMSVAPAADPISRQFPVRVAFEDERLRPGMTVTARILQGEPRPTLMVPADATTQSTLGLVVYRVQPAEGEQPPTVEPILVTLGDHVGGYVVVHTEELSDGDLVVTRGKEQLFPGARIIPTRTEQ